MTGKQMGDLFEQRTAELVADDHRHANGTCNCHEIVENLSEHRHIHRILYGLAELPTSPAVILAIEMSCAFEAGYEYALRQLGGRNIG